MRTAIALCLALVVLGCQSQEERRAEHDQRAQAYLDNEQWSEAKIELLNLIQVDPEDPNAHYELAQVLWTLGEFGDAFWQFREAVRLNPDEIEWRVRLARVEFLVGRYDDAREQVDAILELDPRSVDALILRARIHGRDKDAVLMSEDIKLALEIDPDNSEALLLRARALIAEEDWDGAERTLQHLIDVYGQMASYQLMGGFLVERERLDEAEAAFKKGVEVAETDTERKIAGLSLSNFYMNRGRLEEAEAEILKAREKLPEDNDLLVALARFYVASKNRDKAVAILEERVASEPDEPRHLLSLARFHRNGAERELAFAAIDRALVVDPAFEDARLMRAEFLLEDPESVDEGRAIVEEVLTANPVSTRGLFTKAKILITDGEYDEASVLLRRVLEEQPAANTHFLLGTTYVAMNQDDLARSEFLAALQLDPTHVLVRTQLAGLYLRSDNNELAAQEARRGLEMKPGDQRMTMVLAEALLRLREPEQALELLDSMPFATPDVPWRMRSRAVQLYLNVDRKETARAIANSMIEDQPTSRTALAAVIQVENRGGDMDRALTVLNAAIEQSPEDAKLYRMRGNFYLSFRRTRDGAPVYPNDAQEDLLKSRELDPTDDRTHLMIGQLREAMGNERLAVASFDKAIELNRNNVEAYLYRGQILERQGDLEAAIENYGQVVEAANRSVLPVPRLIIALNNLAWLLADDDNPTPQALDRALELAQEAKELSPRNPTVADTLGWVMHKRDVYPVAITLFREAIANYQPGTPNRALTRYHLALSYKANGEPERAIEELRAALGEAERFPRRDEVKATLKGLES